MKHPVELMCEFKRRIAARERKIKITWFILGLMTDVLVRTIIIWGLV